MWVTMIISSLVAALIWAMIVSGIFHVIGLVSKIKRLCFNKVFPFVFIVFIILFAIHFIFFDVLANR